MNNRVSGSDPEAWVVKGVERSGNKVRVSFFKRLARTKDLQPYFAWVPLGTLEGGTYTLELFEAGDQEVKLARTVSVGK